MKRSILLLPAAIIALAATADGDVFARLTPVANDSIAKSARITALQQQKKQLLDEIRNEDRKRNRQISGVSAETLEEMNDRQDSICLELRSELTVTTLEIKELSSTITSPALIQHYNSLFNRRDTVKHMQGSISGATTPSATIRKPDKAKSK